MPYKSMEDVNDAIKGIDPPVTLAQANWIAALADELEADGTENAWPVAISQFKKAYEVEGDGWVKKAEDEEEVDHVQINDELVPLTEVVAGYLSSREAKTKTVGDKNLPSNAFLVVPDEEKPSTWSLPVYDENGDPDHALMGAAWAALHKGYRGNKYEGEGKADAIKKLKALYKKEKMVTPSESEEAMYSEYWGASGLESPLYVPGAYTMGDALAAKAAEDMRETIEGLTALFMMVSTNILWNIDGPANKAAAVEAAAHELGELLRSLNTGATETVESKVVEFMAESKPMPWKCRERVKIVAAKDVGPANAGRRGPLRIQTVLIQAGPGNSRDKMYYTEDMLEGCKSVFVNAKMFMTDHIDAEKSVRTEASFVNEVVGYEAGRGLIAEVIAYDPDFCEKVRNLRDAKRLDMLHCSIYAAGQSRKGKVGDSEYNVVTSIDECYSVDWVTQAGAGGHAEDAADLGESRRSAMLDGEKVKEVVEATNLPKAVKALLTEVAYESEDALTARIAEMTEEVKGLMGDAHDNGQQTNVTTNPMAEAAAIAERVRRVNERWLG